uniref:RanBD1 domain-containing protein n=1 Tax=Setaria digitata TaxID=48799 RepID=A0A915PVC5_9BILA
MQHTEAEKLFLDKMAVLNKTFLYFIQCSLKEMPDADLSPCVRDYLKHVEELDRTYGSIGFVSNGGTTKSGDNGDKAEVSCELLETSPSEKDVHDTGGLLPKSTETQEKPPSSTTAQFNVTTNSPSVSKFFFDVSTASSTGSEKRGRKRAKKGGPEGDDEEVIISNHNTPASTRHSTSFEKCTETVSNKAVHCSTLPSIFNSSGGESVLKTGLIDKDGSKKDAEKESTLKKNVAIIKETESSKIPLFLFGEKGDMKKSESETNPQKFVFAKSASDNTELDNGLEKEQKESISKSNVTPTFSFLRTVMSQKNESSDSSEAKLGLKVGATPTVQTEPDDESEESEYVPPKPEAVLAEEPKAIFSSKCSVFVLKEKEYEKLGIGQLHIKNDEMNSAKKILLIRAATTTEIRNIFAGTVWVNSYIDDAMKHMAIEDVKLRISCVSNGSLTTYFLRLPNKENRDKVIEELQDDKISP